MRDVRFLAILAVFSLGLFLAGLGNMTLTDPDETFYAETAKEMLDAGDWITPRIFGEPQFEKPVFYYWLIMLSYLVFGVGEFAARFPSAIFGVFGVIGVYFIARLLYSRLSGFFSGLIMATCMQYVVLARACVTDMVLTVFILYSLLFFLLGWTREKKRYYLAAAGMAAIATLTKGPIGLLIPGGIAVCYMLSVREWRKLRAIPFVWCALVFAAVCLPWYAAVTRIHGSTFIGEFFGFQNVTRFLVPEHRIGSSPFFYIPIVLGGFFPWCIFLPAGLWAMRRDAEGGAVKGRRAFLAIWFFLVFIFFSASSTKLVTYIFPLFPVMAVVTGRYWERFVTGSGPSYDRGMRVSYAFLVASGVAAAAATYFVMVHEYPDTALAYGAVSAVLVFTLAVLISFVLLRRGAKRLSFYGVAAACVLLMAALNVRVLPVVGSYESSKVLSEMVNELSSPDDAVGGEDDHRRGVAFYTGRTEITDVHPYHSLKDFMSRGDTVWCIIQEKHYRQLKEENPDVAGEPLSRFGKYVLITNKKTVKK